MAMTSPNGTNGLFMGENSIDITDLMYNNLNIKENYLI